MLLLLVICMTREVHGQSKVGILKTLHVPGASGLQEKT